MFNSQKGIIFHSETPTLPPATSGYQPRADGHTCYTCGGNHLRSDCPRRRNSSERGGRGGGGARNAWNGGRGGHGAVVAADQPRTAMAAWKYIHPVDSNIIVEINGTTWKFCNRCVCSVIRNVGI